MSVNIQKTGVIQTSNEKVNDNILLDTLKDANNSHTTYNIADYNFSESLVNGNKYTIIAKVIVSSDKHGICFYHSGGSYQMGAWQPISPNNIYNITFTANSNMASQTSGTGHGFCRVYVSNNNATMQGSTTVTGTANVEWIKIAKGEYASVWSANPSDSYYISTHGFMEESEIAKIFKEHIEAPQFYEI